MMNCSDSSNLFVRPSDRPSLLVGKGREMLPRELRKTLATDTFAQACISALDLMAQRKPLKPDALSRAIVRLHRGLPGASPLNAKACAQFVSDFEFKVVDADGGVDGKEFFYMVEYIVARRVLECIRTGGTGEDIFATKQARRPSVSSAVALVGARVRGERRSHDDSRSPLVTGIRPSNVPPHLFKRGVILLSLIETPSPSSHARARV